MADQIITPGRSIMLIGNLLYSVGAFLADWNETHVKNPRWPPHARFHNGQTMSLGVLLSSASLYFAFRPAFTKMSVSAAKESSLFAATIGSFYCSAAMSAILYPGADWKDPEIEFGGGQAYLFTAVVIGMWLGHGLETSRLGKLKPS